MAKFLSSSLALITSFASIWLGLNVFVFFYNWNVRQTCAELPNGLMLGTEAIFRSHRYGARSIKVFKRPDGSILVPDATSFLHISATTVYGLAYTHKADGRKNYRFAYRPDVGLVYLPDVELPGKKADPETYNRLVNEAGPLLPELQKGHFGNSLTTTSWLSAHSLLMRHPKYRRTDCPFSWFDAPAAGSDGPT